MTPVTEFVFGCLLLAGGLGLLAHWYVRLPRSGYYNRPEEKARLATRPRMDSNHAQTIAGLIFLGLAFIARALT